jgi:hypothetical protein
MVSLDVPWKEKSFNEGTILEMWPDPVIIKHVLALRKAGFLVE